MLVAFAPGNTEFQSTLLMRGATSAQMAVSTISSIFQSTLLMRGATFLACHHAVNVCISIHAPHARSDRFFVGFLLVVVISIHAPHARSDRRIFEYLSFGFSSFQSTLLMRGATLPLLSFDDLFNISIHAPHARSDSMTPSRHTWTLFQSTLLMRGATRQKRVERKPDNFNPRSSCEERRPWRPLMPSLHYFNPRSSCEERQFARLIS